MNQDKHISSQETLVEIRSIMERSTRFLSLSGWSGIWAGVVAFAGGIIAGIWIRNFHFQVNSLSETGYNVKAFSLAQHLFELALAVFILALAGGIYFTYRRNKRLKERLWNTAARKLALNLAIPILSGAVFCGVFALNLDWEYIASACLVFYGLALVNGSKYTLNDIRYLGISEILLGLICLLLPKYGIYFWIMGFGLLHILYGAIMWRKYENK